MLLTDSDASFRPLPCVHVARLLLPCLVGCSWFILDDSDNNAFWLWNDLTVVLGPVTSVVLHMNSTTDSVNPLVSLVTWDGLK